MDLINNILTIVKNVIQDIFLVDILSAFDIKIRDAKKDVFNKHFYKQLETYEK